VRIKIIFEWKNGSLIVLQETSFVFDELLERGAQFASEVVLLGSELPAYCVEKLIFADWGVWTAAPELVLAHQTYH
jgi:hypothetical protein